MTDLIPDAEQVNFMIFMSHYTKNTEYSLQIVDSLFLYAGQQTLSSSTGNPVTSFFQGVAGSFFFQGVAESFIVSWS